MRKSVTTINAETAELAEDLIVLEEPWPSVRVRELRVVLLTRSNSGICNLSRTPTPEKSAPATSAVHQETESSVHRAAHATTQSGVRSCHRRTADKYE